jgi:hypothetical protein
MEIKRDVIRQIELTDAATDCQVYELPPAGMVPPAGTMYGLTEEEVKIVEGID